MVKNEVAELVVLGSKSIPQLYFECEVSVPIINLCTNKARSLSQKLVRTCKLNLF